MEGTDGEQTAGVWYRFNGKSLVWYPKDDFEAAGYEIPTTWDEMIALSDMIVADGDAPWCVGHRRRYRDASRFLGSNSDRNLDGVVWCGHGRTNIFCGHASSGTVGVCDCDAVLFVDESRIHCIDVSADWSV